MPKAPDSTPSFPVPSDRDASAIQRRCLKEFSVKLPRAAARKLYQLLHELDYLSMEVPLTLNPKLVKSFQDLHQKQHGTELTDLDAALAARAMLMVHLFQQRTRVDKEIRMILASYKLVSQDPVLSQLIGELLFTHYGITLTADQEPKALHAISRAVWYIDGIGAPVDKPLRDLLRYAKRRKVENGTETQGAHNELRKFFDEMVEHNGLATDFEPLYRDEDRMKLWLRPNGQWILGSRESWEAEHGLAAEL